VEVSLQRGLQDVVQLKQTLQVIFTPVQTQREGKDLPTQTRAKHIKKSVFSNDSNANNRE